MIAGRSADWYATVRDNWQRTTAFLLAGSHPCLRIRDEEMEAIKANRVLVGLDHRDLQAWEPPSSWMLAVLVCPDDDLAPLVAWAEEHAIDAGRVHFYLHPDTPWTVLQPWAAAGLPTDRVDDDISGWERLHRLFGLALSERIVLDHGARDDEG